MMAFESLDAAVSTRLVLTLLHSLWQCAAIALVVFGANLFLLRSPAGHRYLVNVSAHALMAICLLATFVLLGGAATSVQTEIVLKDAFVAAPLEEFDAPSSVAENGPDQPIAVKSPSKPAEPPIQAGVRAPIATAIANASGAQNPGNHLRTFAPQLAILYFLGVAIMLGRLSWLLWGGNRLRRSGRAVNDDALLATIERAAGQAGLKVAPVVAWCQHVSVPAVVGILKPLILLPASLAAGLTPEQLQAVLIHELAHVRRCDLLINLMQRVIEAALFFHPAVWYVSWRINIERERACDDLVLSSGCSRFAYADSLLRVAELCLAVRGGDGSSRVAALAVSGGDSSELRDRVLRLIQSDRSPRLRLNRTAGVAFVLVALAMLAPAILQVWAQPLEREDVVAGDRFDGDSSARTMPSQSADATTNPVEGPLHEHPQMAAIIQAVIDNEERYRNLETVVQRTRQVVREVQPVPTSSETLHTVIQGERIYFRGEETQELSTGRNQQHGSVSAFDGVKTRSVEFGNSVNIHLGRYETSQVAPPHTWGMFHLEVNFPISVFLRGAKALRAHPKVRRFPVERGSIFEFYKTECTFEKKERIGDVECVKVRCRRWYYTNDRPAVQFLWLAPERNYLCLKSQSMAQINGSDLPASESLVEKLHEIEPGLWLPMRVSAKYYAYDALRKGELVVDRRRSLQVHQAIANPQRPIDFFRDVEVPRNLPTFIIARGRLVGGPMHPSKSATPGQTSLKELVQRIRNREELYANLDVSVHMAYRKDRIEFLGGGTGGYGGVEIPAYDLDLRSLRIGGRFYRQEQKLRSLADGRSYSSLQTDAYDGTWLRTVSQSNRDDPNKFAVQSVLLRANGTGDDPTYRPHMALIDDSDGRSLSEFLTSQWKNQTNRYRLRVEYEGDQMIGGLYCHRIRYDVLIGKQNRLSTKTYLWLARDRQFLPVRREVYQPGWSGTLPTGLSIVNDLREVKKGVWFPYSVTRFAFRKFSARGLSEQRLIVNWRKDYEVKSVNLDPRATGTMFSEIAVPAGTKIEVIDERGDRIGSYVHAHDGTPSPSNGQWLAILANAKQSEEQRLERERALDALIGKPAPRFPAPQWLGTQPLRWEDLAGRVVLLEFWAGWCAPCAANLRRLSDLNERWQDLELSDRVIIGVHAAGSEREDVAKSIQAQKIGFPVYIDSLPQDGDRGWGTLFSRFAVHTIPQTIVVDQQGKVAAYGRLDEMVSKAAELAKQKP